MAVSVQPESAGADRGWVVMRMWVVFVCVVYGGQPRAGGGGIPVTSRLDRQSGVVILRVKHVDVRDSLSQVVHFNLFVLHPLVQEPAAQEGA